MATNSNIPKAIVSRTRERYACDMCNRPASYMVVGAYGYLQALKFHDDSRSAGVIVCNLDLHAAIQNVLRDKDAPVIQAHSFPEAHARS